MNPKVVLAIVIVLILLFVAAVAVGAASGGEKGESPAAWVSSVGEKALSWLDRATAKSRSGPRLSDRHLVAASPDRCRDLLIGERLDMLPGDRCTFEVGRSDEAMRALPLLLAQGARLELEVTLHMEEEWENERELARGECIRLQFFEGGGELVLYCVDDGGDRPCRLEMPPGGCSP